MESEASQAKSESDNISTEFYLREVKCEELIRQQQSSYDQLMKIKIERDVVAVSTDIQEKSVLHLMKQNEKQQL